ncbi:uncharacterized protein LOC111619454 [Centruroides sculpturatus]|uniref:uncharacterized protein LOC111619454 n=1 Tax=Centruroides sculpturatus TaxID=218467 RepID=UPI000C6E9A78|nr:uncharacterized protein LOC111619454 [Centruroides sculpturatus]
MKVLIFGIAISCFALLDAQPTPSIHAQYCAVKRHDVVRSCLMENRATIIVDIYRNCAMRVKYYDTLDELTEYMCRDTNSEEFATLEKCMDPAIDVEAQANPNLKNIVHKCIKKAADMQ